VVGLFSRTLIFVLGLLFTITQVRWSFLPMAR
jgi:hypothetical protein